MRSAPFAVAVVVVLSVSALSAASSQVCDGSGWAGNCEVANQGDRVEVGGSSSSGGRGSDGGSGSGAPVVRAPSEVCQPNPAFGCRPLYSVGGVPEVTLADLAGFTPAAPSVVTEPEGGVGVVGMATNVVASAGVQEVAGVVLGFPVTVRFSPVSYVLDYGDGATRDVGAGGERWAVRGQPQFTVTSTSHAYRERGTYSVSAMVRYAAAVDFGSGVWRPVAGTVDRVSGVVPVRVVEARTGLVQRTCREDPSGPGCR